MKRYDEATVWVETEDGTKVEATIALDTHSPGYVVMQVFADKPGEEDTVTLWRHAAKVPE